ncbi:hypothetical protein ACFQVC_32715 [Streptomyces monticola]|uniref:Uncharacterized protein n=1 Tax=Streptomyces monticola TaxID=2666263 RepID=A0ABW2JT58_9ACTN
MKDVWWKTSTQLVLWLQAQLHHAREEMAERGERGEGIPTVIIVLATVAGALLIAGGLAALYNKADVKLDSIWPD